MFKKKSSKKKREPVSAPILERKAAYLKREVKSSKRYQRHLKNWYRKNRRDLCFKLRLRKQIRFLVGLKIKPKILSTIRWVIVDFLRAKPRKFWGIYQFVALPGEGKTLSMVAHMERVRKELGADHVYIATNFCYTHENMSIDHWTDMITASRYANDHHMHSVIALDEIHTTFDASDWKSFPPELLALLSFNRKYGMQFLCSSQIYDRIPKKVRDIANYTVICKNTLGLDRHFMNYYFSKSDYEDKFSGKRKRAEFIRTYVAGDDLYALYDTLRQVDRMTAKATEEQDKRQAAIELLFGRSDEAESGAG
ncbi:zonular occludens toxin domain-containing protein [Clostridium transplantifaecale]|uniref:zonular occludens toxin domain-containing protein n=1 Tax=Clostridium transplantifaecale TaxID=2479838 RepID=UPI000F63829A|nr:zonular occludens toxin domain-containing protein [Clostridium transplantifaecale]